MKVTAAVAGAIIVLTLLTYFQFPGHTYLQQDTQIYVPILEHLWDSSVLTHDILVQRPHVAFTLYDELALALRWLSGAGFQQILTGLQLVTRGLGLLGIYLLALGILGEKMQSLLVTAVCALGAAIDGPAVLVIEYEPSPRAFAIPLVFLAIGFMAWRCPQCAGWVAAAGFVLHPPSVLAFWVLYLLTERRPKAWLPFVVAVGVLLLAAWAQPGVKESQPFFLRISPELERLQRFRASYNWVSMWWANEWWKHMLAAAVVAAASWRIRKANLFFLGLTLIGLLSVPLSYVLLDRLKWELLPQIQPARTLLFGTAFAVLLAAACGCLAANRNRWAEAIGWFFVAMVPPLGWGHWWLAAGLAALLVLGAKYRLAEAPVLVGCFFLIPLVGHIVNYPAVHTPQLLALSMWARENTPKDSVFLFPGAGKKPEAGVFRSYALRAIYVDWKGGGQVNYLPELGELWWGRWQDVMLHPSNIGHYRDLGVDYVVLPGGQTFPDLQASYRNQSFAVYTLAAKSP